MAEGRPLLKQKDLMVISYSCSAGTKPTWILSLLLILVAETQVVHGVSPTGFLNIDCGLTNRSTYNDILTNLTYVSDREYVEGGKSYNIMAQYMADATNEQEKTLRSFPDGQRNCYTLPTTIDKRYLIRATFTYGNYDGLNSSEKGSLFLFGLHIGVNFWTTVNLTKWRSPDTVWKEAITVAPDTSISVCLINLGSGTPFISTLDLRKLDDAMFPFVNHSVSISYFSRQRFGPVDDFITRYPTDPVDRFWEAGQNYSFPWLNMTTNQNVRRLPGNDDFQVPTAILQKASTIRSNYSHFNVNISATNNLDFRSLELLPIFHFAEIGDNSPNRTFDIYSDDNKLFPNYTPPLLVVNSMHQRGQFLRKKGTGFTLCKTPSSELPPLINAVEVYSLVRTDNFTTSSDDGMISTHVSCMPEVHTIIMHGSIWLVAYRRCWTADRLSMRGLPHPTACVLCDQQEETIDHILVGCPESKQLWWHVLEAIKYDSPSASPPTMVPSSIGGGTQGRKWTRHIGEVLTPSSPW